MLDSSVYLTSLGWKGKGNGLRHGSASRPLAIPQKRTLAGLGKDRDEAFPFWDHLFAAAAQSIQIKVSGDAAGAESDSAPQSTFLRTTTGILSNRRPVVGTPATSGTATPSDLDAAVPRLSLLATAKREGARKRLYAGFFRGPVLGPDTDHNAAVAAKVAAQSVEETQGIHSRSDKQVYEEERKKSKKKKKRKHEDIKFPVDEDKQTTKKKRLHQDLDTIIYGEPKTASAQDVSNDEEQQDSIANRKEKVQSNLVEAAEEKRNRKAAKAERKKLKEERRKRKEERRKARQQRSSSGPPTPRKD